MQISENELKAIVKTLPVGLYIRRGLSVAVEESETSYYSPHTDEIVVSFSQVNTALSKVADDSPHKEQIVRSILYHEVSHAFITPIALTKSLWNDVINVFEDERMETLLANYYHNVDFKSNVYRFNGFEVGQVPPATGKFNEFYNLVRFRSGTPAKLKKVEEIISKYAKLNRNTPRWTDSEIDCHHYFDDIMALYNDTSTEESQQSDFGGDIQQNGQQGESQDGQQTEGNAVAEGQGRENNGLTNEEIKALMGEIIEGDKSKDLYDIFQLIIDGFNKKNKGGSSIGGYSGTINPRNANREDWKIFDRPFSQKSNNQFGTCHLNLFIDKSGSFYGSENIVNRLLVALSNIEKRNPNFSLDVVFCGYKEHYAKTPKERVLSCSGGNNITDKAFELYRQLQKPNTYNYNIVLFDGDAFSSGCTLHHKNFRAFDHSNCTIISDRENERYINKYIRSAKVIYTKKYTAELITNITNTLSRAFR